MKVCILALVALLSVASGDSIPPPDIRSQSLGDYTRNNLDDSKLLISMYSSALEKHLDSLYLEIHPMLQNVPEIQHSFTEAHQAFLEYAGLWAVFDETSTWYDMNTGEFYYGSGYGYQELYIRCTLYWQQILLYRKFMSSVSESGFSMPLLETLPDSLIGGF